MLDWLGKPVWMWLSFIGIVAVLLALDLGVLHRKEREIGVRESLLLSTISSARYKRCGFADFAYPVALSSFKSKPSPGLPIR